MKTKPTNQFLALPIIAAALFAGSSSNAATVFFSANFNATPVADLGGTIGFGAEISVANLNAGTAIGTWTENVDQTAPTNRNNKMIQTDGGANNTRNALRFGIGFNGTVGRDNALITANLTSTLSLSNTINVSFDQGMISSDNGSARRTFLTGLDGSNRQLF